MAERQQDREEALEVTPVINVMGSTAGAGSGEFHTYRGYRAKEMARLADFERERKQEKAQAAWEAERAEAAAEAEAKHEKNAAKRNKKKEKRKAAIDAEKEAKRAAREERQQQQQQQSGGGGEAESSAPAAAAEADEPAAAAAEEAGMRASLEGCVRMLISSRSQCFIPALLCERTSCDQLITTAQLRN